MMSATSLSKGLHALVRNPKEGVSEVYYVALHVHGHNLTRAVYHNLVPNPEAREHHTRMGRVSLLYCRFEF
jgi:hypothetical protein